MHCAHTLMEYCLAHTSPEPPLLRTLTRVTHLRTIQPRMLSGWQQGLLLQFISQMLRPRFILEIGTFTGYSAICLSEGLQEGGMLHTYDINDETLEIARSFLSQCGKSAQIAIHAEDARKGAPLLGITFDLVFIDGDKRQYIEYYEMALPLLRTGGFIIADNVLWDGKIIHQAGAGDRHTQALQQFNEWIMNDSRTEKLLLPLRDGLSVMRRV